MYGETNFCGCGKKYPLVPGSNPSLVIWNGQEFVVADGTIQLPINLPYIQHTDISQVAYFLTTTPQGVLSKLKNLIGGNITYLLVGGGGANGDSAAGVAGGGGGGGVLTSTIPLKTSGLVINVTVGSGGIAPTSDSGAVGGNGGNSIISYSFPAKQE